MKLAVWMNIPSPYQSDFFRQIVAQGADLKVAYYDVATRRRLDLGWPAASRYRSWERQVGGDPARALDAMADWRERVHIVPGYGHRFLRGLLRRLVAGNADWIHWSEPSGPGLGRLLGYPRKRMYGGLVNRYALGALAIGEAAKRDFARWGIDKGKIEILPYSSSVTDRSRGRDRVCEQFVAGRKALIYAGSLIPRKGIDVVLKAFRALLDDGVSDWVLVLVGNDTPNSKYRRMAAGLGLEGHVLFRGPVRPVDVPKALRCADLFVLASRFDGWGMALYEAARVGLPLISTTAVGAAEHLIQEGRNGSIVKPGSVGDLRSAIGAYVGDHKKLVRQGRESRKISGAYTPLNAARGFLKVIASWKGCRGGSWRCA